MADKIPADFDPYEGMKITHIPADFDPLGPALKDAASMGKTGAKIG